MRLWGPLAATAFAAAVAASYSWIASSAESIRSPKPGPAAPAAPPLPVAVPSPVPPTAPAKAAATVQGLALFGLSGSGSAGLAVLGSEDGPQRIVRVGREFLPGVRLEAVGLDHAVVVEGRQPLRLELRRHAAAAGPRIGLPLGEIRSSEAEQKMAAAALARELSPKTSGGRITGFAVRRVSNLPRLREAGMRDGDVIVSVNGSQFDEERMSELVWELNNAAKTDFVLVRNGKRLRISV